MGISSYGKVIIMVLSEEQSQEIKEIRKDFEEISVSVEEIEIKMSDILEDFRDKMSGIIKESEERTRDKIGGMIEDLKKKV